MGKGLDIKAKSAVDQRLGIKAAALLLAALMSACSVGPDYKRPQVEIPADFKEAGPWKPAKLSADFDHGRWWTLYQDPRLDALQAQVEVSNQNIRIAEAQFRQARALVQQARAGYYPNLGATASETRTQASSGQFNSQFDQNRRNFRFGPFRFKIPRTEIKPFTNYSAGLNTSWEIDVWGRVRRQVEANEANAQASAADLAAMRLSMQAELAQNYFTLRINDTLSKLLNETLAAYDRSLKLTRNQYASGIVSKADVIQAETQYKTTQAQKIDIDRQRAQLEHAIAVLIGKPPAAFSLPPMPLADQGMPAIPRSLPSDLLERRPDIAAAERQMAANNAQIGVAKAAYFPNLSLTASGGYQNSSVTDLFTVPNRFWSIGPQLTQTLFDGGLRRAQTAQARAAYDASVANYRQTVLSAFQDVEDNLADLRVLEQEAQVQTEAVTLAKQSQRLATNQYQAGIVSYLNVVTAQTIALENQRTATSLLGQRLSASVQLIRALGGGWSTAALPAPKQIGNYEPRPKKSGSAKSNGAAKRR
jgi:NodT family efflux transporter outer membrane factor (OMF) lipoprotein